MTKWSKNGCCTYTVKPHAAVETTLAILQQRCWLFGGRREEFFTNVFFVNIVRQNLFYRRCLPKGKLETIKEGGLYLVFDDSRAIHFKSTNNVTTEDLLQAFRRMASRCGFPRITRFDNKRKR